VKKTFRKYSAFFQLGFREHIAHRTKIVGRLSAHMVFILIFAQLWKTVINESGINVPFTLVEIVWYTAAAQLIMFASPRWFMKIGDDVRTGDVAYALNRPISYIAMRLAEGGGAMSANMILFTAGSVLVAYLYTETIPAHIASIMGAVLLGYLASYLHLLFQISIGLSSFWTKDAEALYRIYQKILITLGGLYFPVSYYPDWLAGIANLTPFPAMISIPSMMIYQPFDWGIFINGIGVLLAWNFIAFGLMVWVYSKACHKLEIHGG